MRSVLILDSRKTFLFSNLLLLEGIPLTRVSQKGEGAEGLSQKEGQLNLRN